MTAPSLVRGVGPAGATALNLISMIGIGPLITVPLVLGALHGPLSLVGWLCGALLALCDGLVWAELASLYPGSGGTYGFLRAVFGRRGVGAFLSFLFVWQTLFVAPLNLATGYIGFANYLGYLIPALQTSPDGRKFAAIALGVVTIVALYRGITTISRAGVVMACAAVTTLVLVIGASYAHFDAARAIALPASDSFWRGLGAGLGQALIIAMYDYLGYNQSSCVGDEVREPARTIPRSIFVSIAIVAVLYIAMQLGILGAIAWQSLVPLADGSLPPLGQHLASALVERAFGPIAATVATILVLVTAFASVYGNLLGYSRIPYAAAVDGGFLRPFAHLHATHRFPDVSLLAIGIIALPACLFSLDAVINALTTGIVLVQSIAQIAALVVVRRRRIRSPYRMALYPLPAFVALVGWGFIFEQAGTDAIAYGLISLALGAGIYLASRGFLRRAFR